MIISKYSPQKCRAVRPDIWWCRWSLSWWFTYMLGQDDYIRYQRWVLGLLKALVLINSFMSQAWRFILFLYAYLYTICTAFLPLSPPDWRGIVITVRVGGRSVGCQTLGTHISAWRIFSVPSPVKLSRPVVVHCPGHLPICPKWACPWTKNLAQIGSRLCGTQIFETTGWM